MPNKQEVELFISEDGELKLHIRGIKGPGCLKSLEALAGELGEVQDKELSSEYYESTDTKTKSGRTIKQIRS